MEPQRIHNESKKGKIKSWIAKHSAGVALAAALIALGRAVGIGNLFAAPGSWKDLTADTGLSMMLSSHDFIALFLAVLAVVLGRRAMKRQEGPKKKGREGFVIGIVCIVILVTPIGDALSLMTSTFPVWIRTAYYGMTGQEDKLEELNQIANDGGKTIPLKEGEYLLDAHLNKAANPASGTEMNVTGTLTNQTEQEWESVTISLIVVDAQGNPKKVQSYDEVPILEAVIPSLSPGETAEFETENYPGILESDYENLTDFQIVDISYFEPVENN